MLETKGDQNLFKNLFKIEIDNITDKGIIKKKHLIFNERGLQQMNKPMPGETPITTEEVNNNNLHNIL